MLNCQLRPARAGRTQTLRLHGELDLANADDLTALGVLTIRSNRPDVLVVDLSAVTFVDSTALNALVTVHDTGEAAGCAVRLAGATGPVARVLRLTHLDEVLEPGPSSV